MEILTFDRLPKVVNELLEKVSKIEDIPGYGTCGTHGSVNALLPARLTIWVFNLLKKLNFIVNLLFCFVDTKIKSHRAVNLPSLNYFK